MTKSITARLILIITACCATIVGLALLIDYRMSRAEILDRLRYESLESITGVVTELEALLKDVEGSTQFLARILQQRQYSQPGLEQMLRDFILYKPNIYGATIALNPALVDQERGFAPYLYRRQGSLVRTDLTRGSDNYWQREWYTAPAAAGGAVWIEPYFDAGGAETLMTTYATPVYRDDEQGERQLYAVLTADVTLEVLHEYLQRLRLGESGFGVLFSNAGQVLSARDPTATMRDYDEVLEDPAQIDHWRNMIVTAGQGEVVSMQQTCPGIPGRCMVRLSTLQPTGWPVAVLYSEDEVLQPLRDFEFKTIAVGLLSLLTMALAVALVTRQLTSPLVALTRTAREIAQGNLDVSLPRARGDDEIAQLIRSFRGMKRDLRTHIAELESAAASRSRIEVELSAAQKIQMSMLPQGGRAFEQQDQYALWARVRPAKTVGGDLYQYFRHDDQLYFCVGDVSDKGVPAALFMARAISHIQQLRAEFSEPGEGMARLNNALESGNDNCMFVTLFFGVLDLPSSRLRFASAGHPAPRLLRAGTIAAVAQRDGPALGLVPDQHYPCNELQLQPGDRLAIYTDGLEEAFDGQGAMFGVERLAAVLAGTVDATLEEAGNNTISAVADFAGDTAQSDDITLMLLAMPPATGWSHYREQATFTLAADVATRSSLWLQQVMAGWELEPACCQELVLVLEEIVTNIRHHSGLPDTAKTTVSITLNGDQLVLQVEDEGAPFNPLASNCRATLGADIATAEIGGLGLHLICNLSQQQNYQRLQSRNILQVSRELRWQSPTT